MITKEELTELLQSSETYRIERTISKSNTDKFCEAICAFANDLPGSKKNGYLIIGAEDDGCIQKGFKVDDTLLKNIASLRSSGNILPLPTMTVDKFEFPEGDLLVCEVQPSYFTPVRYRGRIFVRIGPRRDIASEDEERILTERRTANMATFDVMPCLRAKLTDIDVEGIRNGYLPKTISEEVLVVDRRSIEEQMASVGFYDLEHHCPTYAAIILFGKNPKLFLPGAYIQYVKFDGCDVTSEILNERVFNTCLFDMLPKLDTFTENSVVTKRPVAVTAFREEQIINYPKEAIREILLNSVMHRDYNSNMPIRYYEFKDRIEVMNAGGLYGKARPENFPTVNDYRNPIVAGALKNLGYVNMFNRGVRRVKELFEENGNPPVQFNVDKITVFEVVAKAATQIIGTKSNWDQIKSGTKSKVGPSQIGTKSNWDQVKVGPSQSGTKSKRKFIASQTECNKMLEYCSSPRSLSAILQYMGYTNRSKFRNKYIVPMIKQGKLAMTIPDHPTSRFQKYVINK
ncbi:putative DNA binding domain-containing protein [Prevotella cerevisiae]|uniref:DNA binding domain-containing protein n=1 Tax=Segatella cerevisiae TaxID=2053716 RepID=A0ABT1BWZ3_9BACT|nr:RNA-binding domain-containing protein [Segatella cerevisiae]MCO6025571.1 putative DNA binding domain-containing protein [Segatella cerevisiae]